MDEKEGAVPDHEGGRRDGSAGAGGSGSGPAARPDAGADPDADRAGEPSGPDDGTGPRVVVALDYAGAAQARETVGTLPGGTWYKVGLQLFTAAGPEFVRELTSAGHPVMLDLKLHDIPATVEGAVRSAADLGVRLLTVHASGGREMLSTAVRAAAETEEEGVGGRPAPRILAVTVLTSLDDELLSEVTGAPASAEETVGRLAVLAREAGVHGAVASVGECSAIKATCGEDFLVATPGIRLRGGEAHDQKRIATPDEAAAAGAEYLVVGRAVTQAEDPPAALREIRTLAAEGAAGS